MATNRKQVLYAASTPLDAAASATTYSTDAGSRGLVPYFVSGPLSRSGMVGFIGTALHVGAWLCALIFDLVLATQIDSEQAPGAWTLWVWGYTSLMIGFVALVIVTLVHAFSSDDYKIPEGGAPPFLMTLFISGAQISLILTILGIVASVGGTNTDFLYINDTALTVDETRAGKLHAMRNLMVWSMISKAFVVGFIRNNQEWAGPANELKKQAA